MPRRTHPIVKALVAAVLLLGAPSVTFGQIMTFAPVGCSTGSAHSLANTYTEAGATLTTRLGFGTWCADSPNYAGNNLFINFAGDAANLTLTSSGGTFGLTSIDLAHLYAGDYANTFTVNFVGHLAGGGTVNQTFMLAAQSGRPAFTTFAFNSAFADLTSVDFGTQSLPYYQFANVRLNGVTPTPEPATMTLLATGLAGLAGAARRKRNS